MSKRLQEKEEKWSDRILTQNRYLRDCFIKVVVIDFDAS